MSTKFNIAIAGATGNVGREIIQILEDKEFPVDQLYLLASSRSKGQAIEFRGEELIVDDLSLDSQKIIRSYTDQVKKDPVDQINLDDAKEIINFLSNPLWSLPTLSDYNKLLKETEYGSWVVYNRYYLNHYTISVHELKESYNSLEKFNDFLISIGIKLNDSGGIIKKSKDGLLLQSSSVANKITANFEEGKSLISGSYVEFAERKILPKFKNLKKIKVVQFLYT